MNNKKNIGYYAGQLLAVVFAGCVTACLVGILIALTLKFLGWIF